MMHPKSRILIIWFLVVRLTEIILYRIPYLPNLQIA